MSVDPKAFIVAARKFTTDPAVVAALAEMDAHRCGCMWCEMLGDESCKVCHDKPGKVVLSAYCGANFLMDKLTPETANAIAESIP